MDRTATILISDDNTRVVAGLARIVKQLGLGVIEDTAANVVQIARELRPQVILLDIHQPGHDGRDLLATLKADPATADIEVVVMSGRTDPWTRNECLALGALEFLPKPFPADAIDRIAELAQHVQAVSVCAPGVTAALDRQPAPAASVTPATALRAVGS